MARTLDPKKKHNLLVFLQAYFDQYGCAPTYVEMIEGAKLSSKCLVGRYLDALIEDGLLDRQDRKVRTLRLTDKGRVYPKPLTPSPRQRVAAYVSKAARINAAFTGRMISLPVVGVTFAGQTTPIPNADFRTTHGTIQVSEDMLRGKRDQYFALEVSGDSMIDAGIFDGDYVICRSSVTAENGDMVVALLTDSNETTLKYFFRHKDREGKDEYIRLQPANETMQPILIHDTTHLIVQGVVVQVVHCREA